jgi:hypothetical protein
MKLPWAGALPRQGPHTVEKHPSLESVTGKHRVVDSSSEVTYRRPLYLTKKFFKYTRLGKPWSINCPQYYLAKVLFLYKKIVLKFTDIRPGFHYFMLSYSFKIIFFRGGDGTDCIPHWQVSKLNSDSKIEDSRESPPARSLYILVYTTGRSMYIGDGYLYSASPSNIYIYIYIVRRIKLKSKNTFFPDVRYLIVWERNFRER